jgi:Flp pilus assembly protein TadG
MAPHHTLCHLLRRLPRDDRGQSLVEFALTFSMLMAFVFMFIEVCLMFYTYGLISEMAREGSRYAAVHGSGCVTAGGASCTQAGASTNSYVKQLGYPNLAGGVLSVDTTFPDGTQTAGSHARVNVSYTFPITLALVPKTAFTLSTSSTATILQ